MTDVVALVVTLSALPGDQVFGDYTIHGVPNRMPEHALFLEPAAKTSFLADLAPNVGVSDMFRTPESSLLAVETGRGAQPPAFSGHNYGKSIDVMWERAMKLLGLTTKRAFDAWMEARGWYCFWRDGQPSHVNAKGKKTDSETWHYNFFGVGYRISAAVHTTVGYLEAEIKRSYESTFQAFAGSVASQQAALAKLKVYGGVVDGDFGPQTQRAVVGFQRGWDLPATGVVDYRTARTLAYVARETVVVP